MVDKSILIKCPTCGAEYYPVEIFMPNAFFGEPLEIQRTAEHKIIEIIGQDMNMEEQYICNYCNVPFKVHTKVQFCTKPEIKFNFDDDYTMSLKKESLFLEEE